MSVAKTNRTQHGSCLYPFNFSVRMLGLKKLKFKLRETCQILSSKIDMNPCIVMLTTMKNEFLSDYKS